MQRRQKPLSAITVTKNSTTSRSSRNDAKDRKYQNLIQIKNFLRRKFTTNLAQRVLCVGEFIASLTVSPTFVCGNDKRHNKQ